jgi:MoaA/NifB/PqqE/SkfB family radical SAM enzyme
VVRRPLRFPPLSTALPVVTVPPLTEVQGMSNMSKPDAKGNPRPTDRTRRGVLWLGLHCDVRCKFCYDRHLPRQDKIWIALEDATQALDKFRFYYENTAVDFMGGEPTLHPRILDIVRHAAEIGLRPTVITHAMRLATLDCAEAYAAAGIHDFLVSIHGIGDTATAIHGRGRDNFARQIRALDNLRALGIPFRFNVTMIRDNIEQLEAISELAGEKGAKVVNFLTFNPYFEWARNTQVEFQAQHSQIAPYLIRALRKCTQLGIESNVRYMPPCQLPGYEQHVYTGFQLPYDPHEWDYNSWYDAGHRGAPSTTWYLEASERQRQRHHYVRVPACSNCALCRICDGFHEQYVARWGGDEGRAYPGAPVAEPWYFVQHQHKVDRPSPGDTLSHSMGDGQAAPLRLTQFQASTEHRGGVRGRDAEPS